MNDSAINPHHSTELDLVKRNVIESPWKPAVAGLRKSLTLASCKVLKTPQPSAAIRPACFLFQQSFSCHQLPVLVAHAAFKSLNLA